MFAYVNGFLEDTTVDNAVIDVNGFGINVRISADTASRLPGIGEEVRLYSRGGCIDRRRSGSTGSGWERPAGDQPDLRE